MFTKVKIREGLTLELTSNAATPILYRQVFGKDIIRLLQDKPDSADMSDMAKELAFIMQKRTEGANFDELGRADYINWLEQFETYELDKKSLQIIRAYTASAATISESKKKE